MVAPGHGAKHHETGETTMDTYVKLNAADELSTDELESVAAGAFSSMDTNSKITPIALWMLPAGGIYSAAAYAYDVFK
jgi:hypothetical protein